MLPSKLTKQVVPLMIFLSPVFATAASIEVTSEDGTLSLEGKMLAYDGETITLETNVGTFNLRADSVSCLGTDCPDEMTDAKDAAPITIAIADLHALAIARSILNVPPASSSRRVIPSATAPTEQPQANAAHVAFVPASEATIGEITITDTGATETATARGTIQDWVAKTAPSQLLAMKAMSLIAAPNIDVQKLTLVQLAQIFAGEVVNWAEVGGPDIDISVFLTGEETRLFENVQTVLMRPARKPMTPVYVTVQDPDQIAAAVKMTPGGISLVPSDMAAQANTLGITDHCGVTTWPSDFAVLSGDYPLTLSTLVMYPDAIEAPFIHTAFDKAAGQSGPTQSLFALSDADKDERLAALMRQDLSIADDPNAADLMTLMRDADQLAVSFADGPVSKTKGAWMRAHFVRMREAIMAGTFDGHQIVFVGYAHDDDHAAAYVTSQAAADQILTAFRAFAPEAASRDGVSFRSSGHGALSYAACASDAQIVKGTPRIEVWSLPRP